MSVMLYNSDAGWFPQKDLKVEPRKSLSGLKTRSCLPLLNGTRIFQLADA